MLASQKELGSFPSLFFLNSLNSCMFLGRLKKEFVSNHLNLVLFGGSHFDNFNFFSFVSVFLVSISSRDNFGKILP